MPCCDDRAGAVPRQQLCDAVDGVLGDALEQLRRRSLRDCLAGTAGELRPHVAEHAERRKDVVQHLGHVLAEQIQGAAAARAGGGSAVRHRRTGQMGWQRSPGRSLAGVNC